MNQNQANTYMLHSLISSLVCLYTQSCSRHSPYNLKNRQTGMRDLSYWWRKPQASPFIQRLRSQCRHTVCRKLRLPGAPPGAGSAETTEDGAAAAAVTSDCIKGAAAAAVPGAASRPPSKSKLRTPSASSMVRDQKVWF